MEEMVLQWLRHFFRCLYPKIEFLVYVRTPVLNSNFLPVQAVGGRRWQLICLSSCHPHRRPRVGSRLLICPSSDCCVALGAWTSFLCLQDFLPFKIKKIYILVFLVKQVFDIHGYEGQSLKGLQKSSSKNYMQISIFLQQDKLTSNEISHTFLEVLSYFSFVF